MLVTLNIFANGDFGQWFGVQSGGGQDLPPLPALAQKTKIGFAEAIRHLGWFYRYVLWEIPNPQSCGVGPCASWNPLSRLGVRQVQNGMHTARFGQNPTQIVVLGGLWINLGQSSTRA